MSDKEKKHLPFDVARCAGFENMGVCIMCRRKEAGHPTRQVYIYPSAANEKCVDLIMRSSV